MENRSVNNLPEGGSPILKYKNVDNTDIIADHLTKEWIVTYSEKGKHWVDKTFLVHARTIENAFNHFISANPETSVKQLKYYGLYF